MSKQVALRNDTAISTHGVRTPAFMVPDSYQAIEAIAGKLCAAKWVPKSYLDRNGAPIQAMVEVAIMHGLDVGLPPIAAVQNIAVINGMPSVWGDAMMALVEASGLLEDASEAYEGTGDDMRAVCTYRRAGRATPITSTFSVAMAKRAGLWGKAGPWTQYPARMLKLRARSWGLRDGFADVLKGLRMAEEVIDGGHLVDNGSGTFVPANNTPPRPQRSDYASHDAPPVVDVQPEPEPEPAYSLVSHTGEILTWDDPADAERVVEAHEDEVRKGGMAVWNANADLRSKLVDAGYGPFTMPTLV